MFFVFWCSKIFIGGLAKDTTYGKREHSTLFYDSLDDTVLLLMGVFESVMGGLLLLLYVKSYCFCVFVSVDGFYLNV